MHCKKLKKNEDPPNVYNTANDEDPPTVYSTANNEDPPNVYSTANNEDPPTVYSTANNEDPPNVYSTANNEDPPNTYSPASDESACMDDILSHWKDIQCEIDGWELKQISNNLDTVCHFFENRLRWDACRDFKTSSCKFITLIFGPEQNDSKNRMHNLWNVV